MAQNQNLAVLRGYLHNESMKKKFQDILAENAGAFMASIIELYQSDSALQKCSPDAVMMEALKAATLKLPINKQIGFAYIVPFGNVPTFVIGYRGYIQLAMRTGQYRYINADKVFEGETVRYDRLTGRMEIEGQSTSDQAIGYFAHIELLNGFQKTIYWTKEQVTVHAKAKSKSWKSQSSAWHTDFDAMAVKTVLRNILSKYGIMSVEFMNAFVQDAADDLDDRIESEIVENANKETLELPEADIEPGVPAPDDAPPEQQTIPEDADPGF